MATDREKKERLLEIFNVVVYGLARGLWDLFGEASFATTNSIGDQVLELLEKKAGLEIHGESPEVILTEVERLLVDEVGAMSAAEVSKDGDVISMACTHCFLRQATKDLEEVDVQPFACVPMTIAAAAMRKRLGTKHRLMGRNWDPKTETCTIQFELME
jgi:hypothetical protein